ncbi:MAG TPA: helix-turn-helix domain-containing protein [Pyrinomonadaceae bacterium]|nr:helix-turn-helix domain-containing protein [Pyrinomonadaceae bacterium]
MQQASRLRAEGPALNLKIKFLRELAESLLAELRNLGEPRALRIEQGINLHAEVCRFEAELIRCALNHTGGHQLKAARLLGLKATTLNNKIKQYNIQIDKAAGSVAVKPPSPQRKSAKQSGPRKFTGVAAGPRNQDAPVYG